MKITIENLDFPNEIKNNIKFKASTTNLELEFLSGHIIKFNKTNLCLTEPHRIIIKNNTQTLIALLYDNSDKIIIQNKNIIISFTKFISILNKMNNA